MIPHVDTTPVVTSTIAVGAAPFGIAVDQLTDAIYVANEEDNSVSVINGLTDSVTSTIGVGKQPEQVAIDQSNDTIYVVNTGDNSVSVINGLTDSVTTTISVGWVPQGIAVNSITHFVYVVNSGDNSLSVINGMTNSVTSTIQVGGYPFGVGVNPSTNTVYVTNVDDDSVSVINGMTNSVTFTIPVGVFPYGIAVNPSTNTIYVVNTGHTDNFGTIPSSLSVIDGSTGTVTHTVLEGLCAYGVAVNSSTNAVYVADAFDNSVWVLDGSTNSATHRVATGRYPYGIAVDPARSALFTSNYLDSSVSVLIEMPTPSTPIITNLPSSGTYGGSFTPTVTTTGDGQTSVSSATTNVCTVSSGTVNYVGVGTCTLVAHVGTGTNYASADGSSQSFTVISSHSPNSVSVQSVVDGTVLVSWSPPSNNGVTPISSYTATASPGGQTCTTSGTTCTIGNLDASTACTVQVVATNVSGSSLPSTRSIAIYALAASSIKVKVVQFVVPTKSLFTVLAYGAPAQKFVTIAVPGSHKSCTTNAAGQCTVSLSVKNPGSYNALAILGTTTTSSPFYAPSISVPLSAQHGKSFTVAISHAPSIAPVVVTLGDGRVKKAVTNGAGAVSIPVPALIAGLLKVTVSVAGVGFKGSTVLVS